MPVSELVKTRYRELVKKFPNLDLKKEWADWNKWRTDNGHSPIVPHMKSMDWFEERLARTNLFIVGPKNYKRTEPITNAEFKYGRKLFYEKQKETIKELLQNFGVNIDLGVEELINNAVYKETLIIMTVNDWLNSKGSRPHPITHPVTNQIYQLVLKQNP